MERNSVLSPLKNAWHGLWFATGFTLRNRMIFALKSTRDGIVANTFVGLFLILSALVPFIAVYQLYDKAALFRETQAAMDISLCVVYLTATLAAFCWRVIVWPLRVENPAGTQALFDEASWAILSSKNGTRWTLIVLSVIQVAFALFAIGYIDAHVHSAAAVYVAIFGSAAVVLALSAVAIRIFYKSDNRFSAGEKTLMGVHVSTNLTVVAAVVALIVVSAAFMLIYLALFIVVAFILWKVFAANTDPANSIDLLGEEKKPATVRWRDPSGTVHVDQDGQVRESHSGTLMGNVDSAGRVSGTDGTYRGSVGSDGRVR